MKKVTIGILSGALLLSALTGCGAVRIQEGKDVSLESTAVQTVQADGGAQEQDGTMIHKVTLPEQYFITYEIEGEYGITKTISKAVDAQGNIYYNDGFESLFLRDGSRYVLYQKRNGVFVRKGGSKHRLDYIEELTNDFEEYVKKASLSSGDSLLAGESTVAGRDCDVYAVSVSIANYEQKFQYSVDKETHVCLEVKHEETISGFEIPDNYDSFVCTRFDTEDIDLEKEFMTE